MSQLIEKIEKMIELKAELRFYWFTDQDDPREAAINYFTDQLVEKLDELID